MGAKKNETGTVFFHPFEDLKKIIESRGIRLSSKPVIAEKEKSASDEELFINAMREVREIREFRRIPVHTGKVVPLNRKKISQEQEALKVLEEIVTCRRPVILSDTQEYVEWINQDYKSDITRKLHEGRFSVQDCLDLHGLHIDEAEAEVENFIKGSLKMGLRCIKIIHGRGLRSPKGPVLKDAVIKWLSVRYRKNIIAFVTARQCDGGLGALYVLLK